MKVREELAAYAHEAWSGWMRHMFRLSQSSRGCIIIPPDLVERWTRQMSTKYADLPEGEKLSDLIEADRMLAIVAGGENDEST